MSVRRLVILSLCTAVLCCTGCDFLRRVAGRPVSEQIAQKADSIAKADAAAAKIAAAAAAYTADSLAAQTALLGVQKITYTEVRRLFSQRPDSLYSIVLGSFGEASNASKLVSRVGSEGVQAYILKHPNGHQAVLASPTGDIVKLHRAYAALQAKNYLPSDAWILVNE